NLSIKAKDEAEERQAIKDLGSTNTTAAAGSDAQPKTIGDLIKEQMR
ncbi:MAG: S1 RNA-binding domain-containing protein, partial [Moraxellaceae bacterium]